MPDDHNTIIKNSLLAALTKSDLDLLRTKFEMIDIAMGEILQKPNQRLEYAHFPISGICSVIAENDEGIQAETGLIGREGFVGIPMVLFANSAPSQVMVQAEGRALRITRTKFLKAVSESRSLESTLLRFAHTFNVQVSQTALANGHYHIDQRLARWLLMCQDRADASEFPMTHKFLSIMLAVRRAGITDALAALEGKKCIRAMRGRVVITDRKCLEDIAGSAYGVPEKEYERLIR